MCYNKNERKVEDYKDMLWWSSLHPPYVWDDMEILLYEEWLRKYLILYWRIVELYLYFIIACGKGFFINTAKFLMLINIILCWHYQSLGYLFFFFLAESSPRTSASAGNDWRSAFDAAAANGPVDYRRSGSNGHSRNYSDPAQNGDVNSRSGSNSRRTPNRLPPVPPQSISSGYK